MLPIFLYSLLAAVAVIVLAALLPIRLSLAVSGGSDTRNCRIAFDCKALFFNGWFGGGVSSTDSDMRMIVLFRETTLLSFSIAGIAAFTGRKLRERRQRKLDRERAKKPSVKKKRKPLKTYLSMAKAGFGVIRWVLREFSGFVGFDRFSVRVTLGLGRPDITGWISAFLIGLNGILPERYEIVPSWDFTREVIRGDVVLRLTLKGYILWTRLVTRVPVTVYRRRKEIAHWLRTVRGDTSFQEV